MDRKRALDWLGRLQVLRVQVEEMESVLQNLTPGERLVLEYLVLQQRPDAVQQLCQMLEVERSTVYRRKDRALGRLGRMLGSAGRM